MKIDIRIGKLVLHGFDYHDHSRIRATFEQEFARLIMLNGLPEGFAQGDGIPQIYAPSFNAPGDMNPRIIGAEVARSIYKAWEDYYLKHDVTLARELRTSSE